MSPGLEPRRRGTRGVSTRLAQPVNCVVSTQTTVLSFGAKIFLQRIQPKTFPGPFGRNGGERVIAVALRAAECSPVISSRWCSWFSGLRRRIVRACLSDGSSSCGRRRGWRLRCLLLPVLFERRIVLLVVSGSEKDEKSEHRSEDDHYHADDHDDRRPVPGPSILLFKHRYPLDARPAQKLQTNCQSDKDSSHHG